MGVFCLAGVERSEYRYGGARPPPAPGQPGSVFKDHRMVDHGQVIGRHELTDQDWELLAPLMPRAAAGRPRAADRQVVNGMVYKIRAGVFWRDLPERYGPWKTVCTRFRRYALDGVFTRALQHIQAQTDPRPAHRPGPASLQTRPGHRRQGLQLAGPARLPPQTRYRTHHPREEGPTTAPAQPRPPRRQAARIRP